VNEFIVQTASMKIILKLRLSVLSSEMADSAVIRVLPFMGDKICGNSIFAPPNDGPSKKFDFIYPATGEPHKNHQNLIDAFIILAEEGYFPSIALTLDERKFPEIVKGIKLANEKFKLNIYNLGLLPHHDLLELYSSVRHLIYPSLHESFGIPLLEARRAGLYVVAGELDYVRDSISPDQSFNPNSAVSIARAIKRSLGISDNPASILSADEFLSEISPAI
jgi:glycosyltransferase involved in cell wall biosynthesis